MSTFPALIPSGTRTFTPGEYPHTPLRSMGGRTSLVRHSDAVVDQRLRLSFFGLTEMEMLLIRGHYISRRGRFYGFDLPAEAWTGSGSTHTPVGYEWFYADRPQIGDVGCGYYDVSVELEMLPAVVSAFVVPAAVIAARGIAPSILANLILEPSAAIITTQARPPRVITV
jgi:hypothetical protein